MKHIIKDKVRIDEYFCNSDTIFINNVEYCIRKTHEDEITLFQIGVN